MGDGDSPGTHYRANGSGLVKLSARGLDELKSLLAVLEQEPGFAELRMADLFNRLIQEGKRVSVQYIRGHWVDVDDIKDVSQASGF